MKKCLLVGYFLFFLEGSLFAQVSGLAPKVFLLDEDRLPSLSKRLEEKDPVVEKWVKSVVKEATRFLNERTVSVVEKKQLPPSGNKHDYMSMAPYFWPDSSKPDGKPYVRRDGEHNPEVKKITDVNNKTTLDKALRFLSLAYYFTKDEKFAQKGRDFLKVWFIDTATKMNPHLSYAQYVAGVNEGRGTGILETVAFASVANSIVLLESSKAWKAEEDKAVKEWYGKYLDWMLESKNGLSEQKSKNNHGIWYDYQVVSFAVFLNRVEFAKEYIQKVTMPRLAVQITEDGRQPLELARTTSLGYSTFSLEAWFQTAMVAEKLGVDLWHYNTQDNRSFKLAFDWLLPYALGEKAWTYPQIHSYKKTNIYSMLLLAAKKFHEEKYYTAAQSIKAEVGNTIAEVYYDK